VWRLGVLTGVVRYPRHVYANYIETFSLDCLQIFLVVVLDLMTRPRRRPFFLYVNAFCFPREPRGATPSVSSSV
jgi:hypothetical protein